eukprot:TRINITY_DN12820_c0_g1_i2.p2 TRINITY_DN12820_c0_g1~~TRINITY_DN12820_c0_g1_i2.p2  ORF type:complete len:166 (-),score=61.85 TRINITY_DN12820_c0_g1_i2:191-688(-)
MIRRPPRSTLSSSSAASDVYKRQVSTQSTGELATLKNDQHELLLRAVEARLLVDNQSATKSELEQKTSASRSGVFVAGGGVCVQDGALQHLKATKNQKLNEVAELERMLANLNHQSAQLDNEIQHFEVETNTITSQAEDCHAERERNQAHVAILKSSVSDALRSV